MNIAIETKNLSKRYGTVAAVDGLSLQVKQGEIYAFLGLNGAGKTTMIRMLLGMVKPTTGEVYVLGQPIDRGRKGPWAAVGYLVETPHAYPELTVYENLDALRRLHPGTDHKAVGQIIDRLGLSAYANRCAGHLSLGNAQRLGLAKALLHNPALLILDEPANGLDPAGIVEIRELLRQLVREQGVTVFMSSHLLTEVARLADRIGILHQGCLMQELTMDELDHKRQQKLMIRTRNNTAAHAVLLSLGFSARLFQEGGIEVTDQSAIERPDEIATCLVDAGHPPTMLTLQQEELEQYFLRLVGMQEEKQP